MDLSFVRKKAGPLPVWGWMGLVLGVLLALTTWKRNKSTAAKQQQAATDQQMPDSVKTPQYTFVDADTTLVTNTYAPPGGGRPPRPPGPPPSNPLPPRPTPTPPAPTPAPSPAPAPPAPQAPNGVWGTIVKWAERQPKGTPSTLWGLAEQQYGNGKLWTAIWNAPQNATLRAKRGTPEKIQPGDRFWVPK
jgi:hypothetical protein